MPAKRAAAAVGQPQGLTKAKTGKKYLYETMEIDCHWFLSVLVIRV